MVEWLKLVSIKGVKKNLVKLQLKTSNTTKSYLFLSFKHISFVFCSDCSK